MVELHAAWTQAARLGATAGRAGGGGEEGRRRRRKEGGGGGGSGGGGGAAAGLHLSRCSRPRVLFRWKPPPGGCLFAGTAALDTPRLRCSHCVGRPRLPLCIYVAMILWLILFVCDILSAKVILFGGGSKSAPMNPAPKKSVSKTPSAKQQSKPPGEQSPLNQPPAKQPAAKQAPANPCKPAAKKPAAKKLAAETQKEKLSERERAPKPEAGDVKVPHARTHTHAN